MNDTNESWSSIYRFYHHLNYDLADPRTAHLPLMNMPIQIILVLIFYNYFCLNLGQRLMANRPPFDIKKFMIAFDLAQVVANTYIFYKCWSLAWWNHYNLLCAEFDQEDNERNRQIALHVYFYFILKVTDMLDTIFMVLKKKNKHISFLHLYHHTGMICMTWFGAKYIPGGHHTSLGTFNTAVHIVMYSYYLLAALYPNDPRLYNFKRRITQMQMIQFFLIACHSSTVLLVPSCNYPRWTLFFLTPNNAFMAILFYDFYQKTYCRPVKEGAETGAKEAVKED